MVKVNTGGKNTYKYLLIRYKSKVGSASNLNWQRKYGP